jgi:hypothetical protein
MPVGSRSPRVVATTGGKLSPAADLAVGAGFASTSSRPTTMDPRGRAARTLRPMGPPCACWRVRLSRACTPPTSASGTRPATASGPHHAAGLVERNRTPSTPSPSRGRRPVSSSTPPPAQAGWRRIRGGASSARPFAGAVCFVGLAVGARWTGRRQASGPGRFGGVRVRDAVDQWRHALASDLADHLRAVALSR